MKPLVIYHANCADGYGAAFAAWLVLGDEADYMPCQYGKQAEEFMTSLAFDREVYILDFSFPKNVMNEIFRRAARVVWLDHHASVFKDWMEGSFPAGIEIKLSNGASAWVDSNDFEKIHNYSWSQHVKGGAVAYTGGGRANPKNEYMHHLILPQKDGLTVDHINRNTLDNRRCNLRYATRSENGANMDRGSEFKGVTPHGPGFKAQITIDGSSKVIGTYPTKEEAAKSYDAAAREQWGAFARTNFDQRDPLPPNVHAVLDNAKSGAILAWEYFHPKSAVPNLFSHIDDYDKWQFKLEGTKEINKALWSYAPWSFEQWDEFMLPFAEVDLRLVGEAILRAHNQNVQAVVKGSARECWIKAPEPIDLPGSFLDEVTQGWQGLAANCPSHLTSDVGHELANQSGTFGLLWRIDKDNTCICSLRSNGDYDVSAIAKAFGGGGHKNAAGFTIDIQTLLAWTA